MPPPLLFDLAGIDLDHVQYGAEEIEKINPHRGVMRMIDGVIYADDKFSKVIAYRDVRDDEFWVPGHIPGRPLFPGVLMIEAAAQVASFASLNRLDGAKFLGFVGADHIKFRGQVVPGDRLIILGHEVEFRPRRCTCKMQGLVRGTQVFEATITGMVM